MAKDFKRTTQHLKKQSFDTATLSRTAILKQQDLDDPKYHNRAILRTYITLIIAFVCLMLINVYAYRTVFKLSDTYIALQTSILRIRIEINDANNMYRDILDESPRTKTLIEKIRQNLNSSAAMLNKLPSINEKKKMEKRLDYYRESLEDYFPKIRQKMKESSRKKLQETCFQSFRMIDDMLDKCYIQTEKQAAPELNKLNIIYIAMLVNCILLFCFTIYTFKSYVSGRRQAEEELRNTRNNLNTILNSLESMIISLDSQGMITQWNSAAEKYFDIPLERAIQKLFSTTLPYLARLQQEIEQVYHSHHPKHIYKEKVQIGGDIKYLNISIYYCHGINGTVIRVEDVTTMEMKDRQLQRSQKMEVVENLIKGMANDFNNVLGAITGTISALKYSLDDNVEINGDFEQSLEVIEDSSARAELMVQQLLSLSAATREAPAVEAVDLNELIKHILKICQSTFDKSISLSGELIQGAPYVKGDVALLEQVFLSICDNSHHAMTIMRPPGDRLGGSLSIKLEKLFVDDSFLSSHPRANEPIYWVISIRDTGIGMDDASLSKIFDPFFTTKNEIQSSGLGLPMVNSIVEQHNGFIDVSSAPRQGTIFKVYLPFYEKPPASETNIPAASGEEEEIPTGSGLILVVDDEKIMRDTAGNILKKLGYEILNATDGKDAVKEFSNNYHKIDLVLLDIAMPDLSGVEAYKQMKKIHPELKAVLATGLKNDYRVEEAMELGANGCLRKPYSMEALAREVHRVINL